MTVAATVNAIFDALVDGETDKCSTTGLPLRWRAAVVLSLLVLASDCRSLKSPAGQRPGAWTFGQGVASVVLSLRSLLPRIADLSMKILALPEGRDWQTQTHDQGQG